MEPLDLIYIVVHVLLLIAGISLALKARQSWLSVKEDDPAGELVQLMFEIEHDGTPRDQMYAWLRIRRQIKQSIIDTRMRDEMLAAVEKKISLLKKEMRSHNDRIIIPDLNHPALS